jgi:hypothetical protein
VTAAIDTIAEAGYGQASLARIAERAGVSKGVISYLDVDRYARELAASFDLATRPQPERPERSGP